MKDKEIVSASKDLVLDLKNFNRHYVSKGWGYEDWLVNKPDYCGKVLFLKKGKRLSWHYHKLKDELKGVREEYELRGEILKESN